MTLQGAVSVNANETLSDAQLAAIELFKGYPDELLKLATVSCLIIMLIGILGNIITIVALARYKTVRNATAIFIMNLSFSDLLLCFNIPFAASVFHNRAWIHGQILYQISLFTRYTLFVNSLFTMLAITINRYILIAHPNIYIKIYQKRNIIIMLVCTWMFSFGSVIPIAFVKYGSCSILKDQSKRSLRKVIFSTAFALPCIVIILCYARIFCIVRKATKKSLNTGKRVPNPKVSTSDDLSTSVSERITDEGSCNYNSERIKTANMSSNNTIITDPSPDIGMSDKIKRQPEKNGIKSPRFHRATLKKSIKFLKKALPTRKDKRLGTMILAIMIAFFFCHLPITINIVFLEKNLHPKLKIAAHILFFLTFSINPIIYVVMSNEYRKAYKSLFKRQKALFSLSKTKNPT